MKSNEKLWQICLDIYREMYQRATPSADFDELMKNGTAYKEGFFNDYVLAKDVQEEIIQKHVGKHRLSLYDAKRVSVKVHLGCSPRVSKKD